MCARYYYWTKRDFGTINKPLQTSFVFSIWLFLIVPRYRTCEKWIYYTNKPASLHSLDEMHQTGRLQGRREREWARRAGIVSFWRGLNLLCFSASHRSLHLTSTVWHAWRIFLLFSCAMRCIERGQVQPSSSNERKMRINISWLSPWSATFSSSKN